MNLSELQSHFEEIRKMQELVKQLYDSIANDKTDDAVSLRAHYDVIRRELRYIMAHEYDCET
jgi:hypothetical protein